MKRSHLGDPFEKNRSEVNRVNYIKQHSYYVRFLRKIEKQYYANLNEKDVANKKQFWKTLKPSFSEKSKSNKNIALVEDDKIFTQNIKGAGKLIAFFWKVAKTLKTPRYSEANSITEEIANPISKSLLKYDKHPDAIRNLSISYQFEFSFVSVDEVLKVIKNANPRKVKWSTASVFL